MFPFGRMEQLYESQTLGFKYFTASMEENRTTIHPQETVKWQCSVEFKLSITGMNNIICFSKVGKVRY